MSLSPIAGIVIGNRIYVLVPTPMSVPMSRPWVMVFVGAMSMLLSVLVFDETTVDESQPYSGVV